jgi:hypothetical protein
LRRARIILKKPLFYKEKSFVLLGSLQTPPKGAPESTTRRFSVGKQASRAALPVPRLFTKKRARRVVWYFAVALTEPKGDETAMCA